MASDPAVKDYPGTPQHQTLLAAVVACYADDPRIQAVALFGSLARGDWDADSDLDLDVVVSAGTPVDIEQEVRRLVRCFRPGGEAVATVRLDGAEAVDIILGSLQRLSLRYHTLETTSPNIVADLRVLAGSLEATTIQAAGDRNRRAEDGAVIEGTLGELAWRALDVDTALRRGHLWQAVEGLHAMRASLLELFADTRHGARPVKFFDQAAEAGLQASLAATLPGSDLTSVQQAFRRLLRLIQSDLAVWANGPAELPRLEAELFRAIEQRQEQ